MDSLDDATLETGTLSRPRASAADSMSRPDQEASYEAQPNLYRVTDNPDGAILLNVAENVLGWPELRARIETITAHQPMPDLLLQCTSADAAPEALLGRLSAEGRIDGS